MQSHTSVASTNSVSESKPAHGLLRDEYGGISLRSALTEPCLKEVNDLLALAVATGHLNASYLRRDKRVFECLNLDLYDVLLTRGRVRAVIVQERTFWKNLRKARTRLTKRYVLLTRERRSLRVEEIDSATCAKRAKNTTALGQLVRHYLGKEPVRCTTPRVAIERAFKILARHADGTLRSVFDASEYRHRIWRSEAAQPDRKGGYYFYWSEQDALSGIEANTTFGATLADGLELVLCEVEVAGRVVPYDYGKHSASRLRVVSELQTLHRVV